MGKCRCKTVRLPGRGMSDAGRRMARCAVAGASLWLVAVVHAAPTGGGDLLQPGGLVDPEADRRVREMLNDPAAGGRDAVEEMRRADALVNQAERMMRAARGEAVPGDDGQPEWMKDPLVHVAGEMESVSGRLRRDETGAEVQERAAGVVEKLDHLIQLAEQMGQSAGGGGGSGQGMADGSAPAGESTLAPGPGGMGELVDPREGGGDWAQLPESERRRILQSRTEGFPPGFEDVLSEYYSRLAGDGGGDDGGTGVGE